MAYTFFGVQVAVEAHPRDALRKRLHELIASGGAEAEQSLSDKRDFYKRLTGVLNEAVPVFALGYWDYVDDDNRAEVEFDTWCSELEGSVATVAEELGAAHDEVNRLSAANDYILVTLLFLLEAGEASDCTVRERCDLPEAEYFSRLTFGKLIATIPMLSFATVKADAVYLVPGTEEDGLSMDDLQMGGYEYLKPLS